MAPFGGEPTRGFDASSERLKAMERYFQAGEADLELVQSYASGNIVVLVVIERQHGEVGGLPDQEWSLRVTLSIAVKDPSGSWCIVMPTRWSTA